MIKEVMVSFPKQLPYPLIFYLLYHFPQFCSIAAVITRSPSSARPVTARREIGEDGESTCWEPSARLSQEAKDESPPDPGVRGHPSRESPHVVRSTRS